jgi:predicted AAA+ superfamily ATPase
MFLCYFWTMIVRELSQKISSLEHLKKAVLVVGPRQVGKTTLIKSLIGEKPHILFTGDDPATRQLLSNITLTELKRIMETHSIVFVDEAQRINSIGLTLKLITDHMPGVMLYISGSSALELNKQITESLTGRKLEYKMFPVSWSELHTHFGYLQSRSQLVTRLIYGFYPEVISSPGNEKEILMELTSSYLFKDILAIANIQKPAVLEKLLTALALQIGSEVNYNELAKLLEINKKTVETYIYILEQAFLIFRIPAYSKNVRNEISRGQKIYFYDLGIRNTLLANYNSPDIRTDKGAIWENFLLAERLKYHSYNNTLTKMHFWRTTQQQEIDLVETNANSITAYEFKWNVKKTAHISKTFTSAYNAETYRVNQENFVEFVMGQI